MFRNLLHLQLARAQCTCQGTGFLGGVVNGRQGFTLVKEIKGNPAVIIISIVSEPELKSNIFRYLVLLLVLSYLLFSQSNLDDVHDAIRG